MFSVSNAALEQCLEENPRHREGKDRGDPHCGCCWSHLGSHLSSHLCGVCAGWTCHLVTREACLPQGIVTFLTPQAQLHVFLDEVILWYLKGRFSFYEYIIYD